MKVRDQKSIRLKFILAIIFLMVQSAFFGKSIYSQDIDEMGNLWIITLDKSRSMTTPGYRNYIFNELLSDNYYSQIDFSKDSFIFYESGIVPVLGNFESEKVREGLKRENDQKEEFVRRFIRPIKGQKEVIQFNNPNEFEDFVRGIYPSVWSRENLPYTMSFVSLIRPLSLEIFLRDFEGKDFFNYDQIIVCSITDDADQNDQWLTDYKTIRNYAPDKQKEIDTILSRLIYNPFNLESSGFGQFNEVLILEELGKPKLFAYSYETVQGLRKPEFHNSILSIEVANSDSLRLSLNENPESYFLLKIDSLLINNSLINHHYPLNVNRDSATIFQPKLKILRSNDLRLSGSAQLTYVDSLLGRRIKTAEVELEYDNIHSSSSPLHKSNIRKIFISLSIAALVLIGIYILILFRKHFVIISPSGQVQIYQKGFNFKTKSKNVQLAGYLFSDRKYIDGVFLKGQFIKTTKIEVGKSNNRWVAIATTKPIKILSRHEIYHFDKKSKKQIQGIEEDYHTRIRKKYGRSHHIYFLDLNTDSSDVIFESDENKKVRTYTIAFHHQQTDSNDVSKELINEKLIGKHVIENRILYETYFSVLFNEILIHKKEKTERVLKVNVLKLYENCQLFPVKLLLKYELKVSGDEGIESLIEQEKTHLSNMLSKYKLGVTYTTLLNSYDLDGTRFNVPIKHTHFPTFLSLFSNEDEEAVTQMEVYSPFKEEQYIISGDSLFIKVKKPKDVHIKHNSMQLLWHPHDAIKKMDINKRKVYAINGEDYLNMDDPEFIDIQVERKAKRVKITCFGQQLPEIYLTKMYLSYFNYE